MEIDFSYPSDSELSQIYDEPQDDFWLKEINPQAEAIVSEIFRLVQFWTENRESQSSEVCYQSILVLFMYLANLSDE